MQQCSVCRKATKCCFLLDPCCLSWIISNKKKNMDLSSNQNYQCALVKQRLQIAPFYGIYYAKLKESCFLTWVIHAACTLNIEIYFTIVQRKEVTSKRKKRPEYTYGSRSEDVSLMTYEALRCILSVKRLSLNAVKRQK